MLGSAASLLSKVVLGSKSQTRHAMLEQAGSLAISVISPDIDEYQVGLPLRNDPNMKNIGQLVVEIAKAKADRIIEIIKLENAVPTERTKYSTYCFDENKKRYQIPMEFPYVKGCVVTGDQVVTCNNLILEKPTSHEELVSFYRMYSNSKCTTVGSIVLTDIETNLSVHGVDIANIYFHPIPVNVLQDIITLPENQSERDIMMHCCGGLMIEHSIIRNYIVSMDNTEDTVLGLSKASLCRLAVELQEKIEASTGVRAV